MALAQHSVVVSCCFSDTLENDNKNSCYTFLLIIKYIYLFFLCLNAYFHAISKELYFLAHCTWLTFQSTLGYGDVTSLTDVWIAFLSTPDLLDLPFIRFFPLALDFPLLWDPLLEPFPFSFLTRLPFLSNSWQSYFSWEIQKENSPHTIFLSLIRALFLLFFCDSSPLVFFWFSVCSSFAFLFWVAGEAAMKVIISISF